ncbi:hypothetical protein CEY00_Acc17364 [Actinidia chinensis var. chinensis]|uniref:Uncharacterized protein n=1 Tax=Actinidia chinensis var. chinensis TaxID=1590841 RepID=A0A2R6QLI3_ACTCC|nr:hypothetical protein CEY00_Acc17364 [Actinidia chinensis var. chinensis]
MGCCASSNYKPAPGPPKRRRSSSSRSAGFRHSAAPPPHPEEETVKEVLSETPNPKPPISKIEDEEKKIGFMPSLHKIQEIDDNVEKKKPLMSTDEVSEVSEICSLSESVSTAVEKREDEGGEVRRRVEGSPARRPIAGKSPARRVEPDLGWARPVPARDRRSVMVDGPRRDFGESSGRRSRSPAARGMDGGGARAGLGRSPSARKTGKSPGRVRSELNDKTRMIEDSNRWPSPTTNELLENPLVSLECFIFL